jgi:uncharacterized membrane protein YeaQ/YmgE (transglycosylase-associated protein family)
MDTNSLLIMLVIGAVAGWLAGLLVRGFGFGLIGNIVVGILGAVVGSWLFTTLRVSIGGGWIDSIFTATVGAVVLLFVVGVLKKLID